eukprot:6174555-Pleurochrysis_carterae.AAC.1
MKITRKTERKGSGLDEEGRCWKEMAKMVRKREDEYGRSKVRLAYAGEKRNRGSGKGGSHFLAKTTTERKIEDGKMRE